MFAYCNNNPIMYVDPNGDFPWIVAALVAVAVVCVAAFSSCSNEPEPVTEINYDVPLYSQGDKKLCWSYCQTMVESYQEGTTLTQFEADVKAINLAKDVNGEETWNRANWPTNLGAQVKNVDSIETVRDVLLYGDGPCYAYYNGNNSAHMVVVTGVNIEKNIVYTNNPWGIKGEQTFEEFRNGFLGGPNSGYGLKFLYYVGG